MYSTEIKLHTYYRESTSEWIGEFDYQFCGEATTCRFTGSTEKEALHAALAALPGKLLEATWNEPETTPAE